MWAAVERQSSGNHIVIETTTLRRHRDWHLRTRGVIVSWQFVSSFYINGARDTLYTESTKSKPNFWYTFKNCLQISIKLGR